jgi:hypothetical protein
MNSKKYIYTVLTFCLWSILAFTALEVNAQTVYVTKTGKKYHKGHCHYLRSSKISTTKHSAIQRGFTQCSYCLAWQKPSLPENGTAPSGSEMMLQAVCTFHHRSDAKNEERMNSLYMSSKESVVL